ncbi:MAG TPA: hypothetical protein VKA26_02050 [Ignavibacteriaceae bacterium]|nr:hypothetical protein [Ignavibacteriaceae bacterium]
MKLYSKIFLVIFVALSQCYIFPQTSSSYTRIGIGDLVYTYSGRRFAMGQLGSSVIDKDYISLLNPASLTGIQSTRTEFGMKYTGLFLQNNSASSFSSNTDFSGVTLAIPISQNHGIVLSMGLLPYSNVSYKEDNIVNSGYSDIGFYKATYEGNGGLSKLFLGSSFRFPFDVSIGATMDYYFGNLNYLSSIEFPNNAEYNKSEFDTRFRPHGFGATVGLISPDLAGVFNSEAISNFRLGAAFNFKSRLETDSSLIITSTLGVDSLNNSTIYLDLPYRFSAGASFILNNNYLFTFDYSYQPWSEYKLGNIKNANLSDSYKLSSGFEYRRERSINDSFWEQMIWRMGLSFEQTQYKISGQSIKEYSIMGGFTIPLSYQNTIDIGIQYALRGTTDLNLFKENIIKLSVGISLGELWFIRRDQN